MELSVRDWMIIIGVLLIVAVLLDGYRRMRDPRRIRVSLKRVPEVREGEDVSMSRELPNGGARVRPRSGSPAAGSPAAGAPAQDPAGADADPSENADSPSAPEAQDDADVEAGEPPLLTEPAPAPEPERDPLFDEPAASVGKAGENLDLLEGIGADENVHGAAEPEEVLMLHVVARDEAGFAGEDILQVLLAYNLRFGDMDFFHRHEASAGKGAVQFSVANMLKPGVFDIDRMSDFSTSGLIFFMTLPGPKDMMGAFEQMLETARGVAENLGGDVLDETRSATTRQTLEHMRQRIRDLERKLLAQAGR